jgi:hypothetical protein
MQSRITSIVDGSTLAAAFILNSIPEKETSEVLIISGGACNLESGIARVLCERGVRVQVCISVPHKSAIYLGLHSSTLPSSFIH